MTIKGLQSQAPRYLMAHFIRKWRQVVVLTDFEDNEVRGQLVIDLLETSRIKAQE